MTGATISQRRRQFLASIGATGAGLLLPVLKADGAQLPTYTDSSTLHPITPWIRIAPDDTVVIYLSQTEVGQGISTGLAQLLADELDADWSSIRIERAPIRAPYQVTLRGMSFQGTFGSTSTSLSGPAMRQAGAAGRAMLVMAGAASWDVPVDRVVTDAGWVLDTGTGRRLSYGVLARSASQLPMPTAPRLKTRDEYRYVGKRMKRLDTPLKTDGSAVFGIDVRVPGMWYGAVVHAPVFGSKIVGSNVDAVAAMPGVKAVVPTPGALVVVAESWWQASKAAGALVLETDAAAAGGFSTATFSEQLDAALAGPMLPAHSRGRGVAAFADASRTIEARYDAPYLAHASLEPPCATADVRPDGATFWLPVQQQTFHLLAMSKLLGLRPDQVEIRTTYVGGSFGRKNPPDFATQAALASRAVGRPVKLVWSRPEDIQHDKYRPAFRGRFRAGLDADGRLSVLHARIAAQSLLEQVNPSWIKDGIDETTVEGTATSTYAIAHMAVESINMKAPVPLYFWRSVGNSPNVFMLESFVDEIAHASGRDPYLIRREMLSEDPRGIAVLDAVANSSGWSRRKLPKGTAMGIAYFPHRGRGDSYVTRVAQVVELSVDAGRNVRLHRIHVAVDAGTVINPNLLEAQMQGGIGQGLMQTFHGKITFDNGRVQQSNFHDYRLLTLAEMPRIVVTLIDSDLPPSGAGEIGVTPVAPAVANAIFAASGVRLRRLPFSDDGFRLGPRATTS